MSQLITKGIGLFIILYLLIIIIELISNRNFKRFILELSILLGFIFILYITTGFPVFSRLQAFGGVSPLTAIAIMFVCTLFGIIAHYFFTLKGKFSWRKFLKPLFISPIVFLPLLGSVQSLPNLENIQLISFGILAFQNGFFWKVVFEHAQAKV